MDGTYDIRKVPGTFGGVTIDRSNVTLAGQGHGTRLILAPGQNTNVIRIIGSGVGDITIRDLLIDQNRDQNPFGDGEPSISHDRFEYCGIKAFHGWPGQTRGTRVHDITVRDCRVSNARRLNIMLDGRHLNVLNNHLGNATSDSVELLHGPGQITGNYVEITEQTHVAIGTDRADDVVIDGNIVHVKSSGRLDNAFRTWAESQANIISNNVLIVDKGGRCRDAIYIQGCGAVISGNCFRSEGGGSLGATITGGNTLLVSNLFENMVVVVNDRTGLDLPILLRDNLLYQSIIRHVNGRILEGKTGERATVQPSDGHGIMRAD